MGHGENVASTMMGPPVRRELGTGSGRGPCVMVAWRPVVVKLGEGGSLPLPGQRSRSACRSRPSLIIRPYSSSPSTPIVACAC